jgi:hypothetical protein
MLSPYASLECTGKNLLKNISQQIIVKELRSVVCYGMLRSVVLYVCSNPKIRQAHSGFSDVTFYLNVCRLLEIWTVGKDMNCIL